MIKKIIVSACLLISFVSFAQQGTASPYSFYGIGDTKFKGTHENRSMGGVSVEQDSIHMNVENPSSYANLGQTTFSLGATYGSSKLKSNTEAARVSRSTFDYLLIGIPMGKFGAGFGLIPVSSVGYKVASETTVENKQFEGKGGVNKAFFGLGYKIKPNWNIGADLQYSFGKIETSGLVQVNGIESATSEINTSKLTGVNFNIGTMYQTKVNKRLNVYTSLAYTFASNLKSDSERAISVGTDANILRDVTDLKIPSRLTIGAGIGEARKWLVGSTVAFQGSGNFNNYYNSGENVTYESASKYAVGGYYIPNYTSFTSYLSRVTYRGGFKYEKTGLVINNESINDVGMSLGAGFPITGSFSNINFGIEFGKRGTVSSNLIQENYLNFSIGLSFNDKWFIKSKFN
jgi:hypothetical protein